MNHQSIPQLMQNRGSNKRSSLSFLQKNNIRIMFPNKNPKTANCRGLRQPSTISGKSYHISGGGMAMPAASRGAEVLATASDSASNKSN